MVQICIVIFRSSGDFPSDPVRLDYLLVFTFKLNLGDDQALVSPKNFIDLPDETLELDSVTLFFNEGSFIEVVQHGLGVANERRAKAILLS